MGVKGDVPHGLPDKRILFVPNMHELFAWLVLSIPVDSTLGDRTRVSRYKGFEKFYIIIQRKAAFKLFFHHRVKTIVG